MEHKAYEAVKAQHERIIAINGDGAMPRDYGQNFNAIAQLLADYEALRAERDALRAALEFVGNYASVEFDDHNGTTPRGRIRRMCAMALNGKPLTAEMLSDQYPLDDSAALNAQPATAPAAEWTPRNEALPKWTLVINTNGSELLRDPHGKQHDTSLKAFVAYDVIDRRLTAPVDESEAQAEWTPRLGEEVWINADSRVGTVIRINQDSDYPYGVAWDSPAQVNEWYAIEDISRHEFD